jgi:hypothetical protein
MSESEKAAESLERDDKGRFVVESEPEAAPEPQDGTEAAPTVEPEPEAAPIVEAEPEQEKPETPKVAKPSKKKAEPVASSSKLEGGVVLSALVFEAPMPNSASVRLVQDRLAELGHGAVRRDRPGWISDGTVDALKSFQDESGLEVTGEADAATVDALMRGTKVKVS